MDPCREQVPGSNWDGLTEEPASSRLDDLQVIDAVDEYLSFLQAGGQPDREALLARFPGLRDEIAGYLEAVEFIHEALVELLG
jgi:hypothetical protein